MNAPIGFQAVVEYFKRNKWTFHTDESGLTLTSSFRISNGTVRCTIVVEGSDDLIQVVGFMPFAVPQERRSAAGELCVRLSSTLKMGRFDMNYETGEVHFHTGCVYPKGELKDEVIGRLIGVTLAMADGHFRAFTATLYANALPAVAALQASGKPAQASVPASQPQLEARPRIDLN